MLLSTEYFYLHIFLTIDYSVLVAVWGSQTPGLIPCYSFLAVFNKWRKPHVPLNQSIYWKENYNMRLICMSGFTEGMDLTRILVHRKKNKISSQSCSLASLLTFLWTFQGISFSILPVQNGLLFQITHPQNTVIDLDLGQLFFFCQSNQKTWWPISAHFPKCEVFRIS